MQHNTTHYGFQNQQIVEPTGCHTHFTVELNTTVYSKSRITWHSSTKHWNNILLL